MKEESGKGGTRENRSLTTDKEKRAKVCAPVRDEGDRQSMGSKGVNVEKGTGLNEKDEERRSAGYSVPSNRPPRSKCG